MLEAEHSRSVRVRAPLPLVWDELGSLDRVMKQVPEVGYFQLEPDGRTAAISAKLAWGPLDWKFGQVSLAESEPPHHLTWTARAPRLQLTFEGTFDLAPAAIPEETLLTYRGVLHCRHKLIGRLNGALGAFVEGHVNGVTDRLAALAAQHAEAEARLSRPLDSEPPPGAASPDPGPDPG